jgi:hypothetical protein
MKGPMLDSPQMQEPFSTGLDYFRQAAEDFSRQPAPTLEGMRAQSKRNREQAKRMEGSTALSCSSTESGDIEARATPEEEANYARALLEIFDGQGKQWIEEYGLTTLCDDLRALRSQRSDHGRG